MDTADNIKTNQKAYKKVKNRIINGVSLYLIATVILYFIGPFEWKTRRLVAFCIYNFAYISSLYFGFQLGSRLNSRVRIPWKQNAR